VVFAGDEQIFVVYTEEIEEDFSDGQHAEVRKLVYLALAQHYLELVRREYSS
jgi:hypothetical protein